MEPRKSSTYEIVLERLRNLGNLNISKKNKKKHKNIIHNKPLSTWKTTSPQKKNRDNPVNPWVPYLMPSAPRFHWKCWRTIGSHQILERWNDLRWKPEIFLLRRLSFEGNKETPYRITKWLGWRQSTIYRICSAKPLNGCRLPVGFFIVQHVTGFATAVLWLSILPKKYRVRNKLRMTLDLPVFRLDPLEKTQRNRKVNKGRSRA